MLPSLRSVVMPSIAAAAALSCVPAMADPNRIDRVLPDAPELAAYGPYATGTRELDLVNPDQIDVAALDASAPVPDPLPTYDRPLRVQLWYPAFPGATGSRVLPAYLRDGRTEVELVGRAVQWAAPVVGEGPFPLLILSHGYPGNRLLLSHLADNLASKGYVVASIDHTDSTYRTQTVFGSTLRNRRLDQLFVLDEMERLGADPASFLSGLVDASRSAIVGYSMGGYGALITVGAGVTAASVDFPFSPPFGLLAIHESGSDTHEALIDPRVRTAVAFAPWGRNTGFFDADTLEGIAIPLLLIAGSVDDVSGYEDGTRAVFEEATNSDRALLTFVNANHNAGAPMPPPEESYDFDPLLGFAPYEHYADPVWDSVRMNNVSQHFVSAWLGKYLKGEDNEAFLDLVENANESVWSVGDDGDFTEEHSYWAGFANRTAAGMRFERRAAGE